MNGQPMRVRQEQASIREQAADYTLDGKQVPDELVRKYNQARPWMVHWCAKTPCSFAVGDASAGGLSCLQLSFFEVKFRRNHKASLFYVWMDPRWK